MTRPLTRANRPERDFPILHRLLWQGLVLGAIAAVLMLAANGGQPASGAVIFWLLAAPAAALLTLHRQFLAAAWRAHLVRATPRRRQRFGVGQARRASRARRGAFARAA